MAVRLSYSASLSAPYYSRDIHGHLANPGVDQVFRDLKALVRSDVNILHLPLERTSLSSF
jgi:hypothetical protein